MMDSAYSVQGKKSRFAFFEMKEDLYEKIGKKQREGTGVFFFDRFS